MAMLGADIEELQRLAKTFKAEATKIQGVLKTVDGRVNAVVGKDWKGGDAKRFQSSWNSYKPQLKAVIQALEDASNQVKREAEQQKATSA